MSVVLFVLAFYGIAITGVFCIVHSGAEDVARENRQLRRYIRTQQQPARAQHPSNVVPLHGLDEVSEEWLG